MTPDPADLRDDALHLLRVTEEFQSIIVGGTREQWNAALCIKEASDRLWAAATWLERHNRKVTEVTESE